MKGAYLLKVHYTMVISYSTIDLTADWRNLFSKISVEIPFVAGGLLTESVKP